MVVKFLCTSALLVVQTAAMGESLRAFEHVHFASRNSSASRYSKVKTHSCIRIAINIVLTHSCQSPGT